MFWKLALVVLFSIVMLGCGTKKQKQQVFTPDLTNFTELYEEFSCDQLYSEARRISKQMDGLAGDYGEGVIKNRMVIVGSVIYWPILLVSEDTDPLLHDEYRQLEARMVEINSWAANKSCDSATQE